MSRIFPKVDVVFWHPCFLFNNLSGHPGRRVFSIDGLGNLKKVKHGKRCSFLKHVGIYPNSPHKICEQAYEDLNKQA